MSLSPRYWFDYWTGRKARRLAAQMPKVMTGGGIFTDAAWHPALEAADLDLPDTKVFADGGNVLVLVYERWLIRPSGPEKWVAKFWWGFKEPPEMLRAADDDEALDSRLSRWAAHLHRIAPLLAPLVVFGVVYAIKLSLKAAGHDVLTYLPSPF